MDAMSLQIDKLIQWLKGIAPNANLQSDSRLINRGDIFFAFPIPESTGDGRRYIQAAIDNGAALIVYEASNFKIDENFDIPSKGIFNLIHQVGYIVAAWHQHPDKKMFTVAVTGTNGKTSCTQWIARALSMIDESCAVIGTIGVGNYINGNLEKIVETGFTTPDAIQLQKQISSLRESNIRAIAIEASSIGLHQGRMNGMHIDTAIFTNLTLDHLDYHHNLSAYALAKEILFHWPYLKNAIINIDDACGMSLIQKLKNNEELHLIAYGIETINTICNQQVIASQLRTTTQGTSFYVKSPFGQGQIKTQVIGKFNVSNILSVLCVLLTKGIQWEKAVSIIEKLQSVPGRMQKMGSQGKALVVVDYAHTPDALEKTIDALQELVQERQGELWCVFGCGGDRDVSKRSPMGRIAQKAHHAVVTSDNPRTENPIKIIQDILIGMNESAIVIEDRAAAILYAIKHAKLNDVILIAGKGHENYQEINGKKTRFSDEEHALLALATVASNNSMRIGGK